MYNDDFILNLVTLMIAILGCGTLIILSKLGMVKPFFPRVFRDVTAFLYPKPLVYDEHGKQILVCSGLTLHNIKGSRCVWCGESIDHIRAKESAKILSNQDPPNSQGPLPDFNSPTTATVNVPKIIEIGKDENILLRSEFGYCSKCKVKVDVLDSKFETQETRSGSRKVLKGSCAVCGTKIFAFVKVGD
jgi:hypothetical protein